MKGEIAVQRRDVSYFIIEERSLSRETSLPHLNRPGVVYGYGNGVLVCLWYTTYKAL
jgi:hypothetical protein